MVIKRGTITISTSAAQTVNLGWIPEALNIINIISGDELKWTRDMPDGYGYKRVAAGTGGYITTGGITPLGDDEGLTVAGSHTTVDGDTTTMTGVRGFSIGTDTDINVCGEIIDYVAFGLGQNGD